MPTANDGTNLSSSILYEQVNKDFASIKGEYNQIKPIEAFKTKESKNTDINDKINWNYHDENNWKNLSKLSN